MAKIKGTNKYSIVEIALPVNLNVQVQNNVMPVSMETLENGTFVSKDVKTGELGLPVAGKPCYLVASDVTLYEKKDGIGDFVNKRDSYMPRIIGLDKASGTYLRFSDVECAEVGLDTFAKIEAYLATPANKLYAHADIATGNAKLVKALPVDLTTIPTGFIAEVTEVCTMRNGEDGIEVYID